VGQAIVFYGLPTQTAKNDRLRHPARGLFVPGYLDTPPAAGSECLQPTCPSELNLLLACGSPPSERARTRVSSLLAGPLDWPFLAELAESQGMLPLLSRALAGQASGPLHADIRAKAAAMAMRSLSMAGELARILAAMQAAGVTAIAFKGLVLAHLAYGDLALRSFADLDIFVPRPQLRTALDLLAADGYGKITPAWDIRFSGACEIALRRRDPDCDVDLHWLFSPPYFLPFDPVRATERSTALRAGGLIARTLRPEDHLLYLCIHAALEGWGLVRFPCDIAGILSRCALDWDDLVREARRTGCWRALALGLDLAHELCEAPVPPDVLQSVKLDRAVSELSARARPWIGCDVRDSAQAVGGARFHLKLMETPRAKARYIWRRAIQPNQLDAEWVLLPPGLSAAYYAVRPLRLACTALRRPARGPSAGSR